MAPNQALEAQMAPNQALEAQMAPNQALEDHVVPNQTRVSKSKILVAASWAWRFRAVPVEARATCKDLARQTYR